NNSMLEARRKKADLELELAALTEQGSVQIENRGTLVFLCTEPDVRVYTDVRPIMDAAGFTGVVALSYDSFPGEAGCLSEEQMKKLLADGWDTVVTVQKNTDVKALFQKAKAAGFAPKGIYYPTPQVDEAADSLAKDLGVRAVFTYSSDEISAEPSVYRILTLGCNENGIKNVTENSIASSRTMALSIGFRNSRELFDETSVTNMVAFVKKNTDAEVVKVASVDGAISGKNEVEHLKGEALKKTENKRKALQAQIDELNDFILTGETVVAASETEKQPGSAAIQAATKTVPETVAFIRSETETAEASSEDLTEPTAEAESETEKETEPATEKVTTEAKTEEETKPTTTEAVKETESAKVTETKAAKKKKTGKTPAAPPPPEIEETPGEVYVESTAATSIYSEKELESGTNWPVNVYYDNEYTPGGPASADK
ncbi:MAG: hypothetical protein KBS39_04910, partial [Lachnospiraceae bacterium]|nr:hypothetical protein [Candidatus Hippenecus merdae]